MSEPLRLAKVIPLPVGMLVEFPFWRTEAYRRLVRTARRLQRMAATLLGCAALATAVGLASGGTDGPVTRPSHVFVLPPCPPAAPMPDGLTLVATAC